MTETTVPPTRVGKELSMIEIGAKLTVEKTPTPVGMKVWAEAEITAVSENGKMIDFAVKAWDEKGPIGAGTHTRAIITNDRFLSKCNSKLEK